jgi:hypothetical protein
MNSNQKSGNHMKDLKHPANSLLIHIAPSATLMTLKMKLAITYKIQQSKIQLYRLTQN